MCRGMGHLFFGDEGKREPGRHERVAKARELCNACPVIDQCRDYAIRNRIPFGIWAGMSERQRRKYKSTNQETSP